MRRRGFRPDYPLIFLHLPKTAGTTLNGILARQYAGQTAYAIKSDRLEANIESFKTQAADARHRIRLLLGHQAFGLHGYLAPGARYITVIREPVARVISHYHYVRSHRHPKFIEAIESERLDLHKYVTSTISGELENGQTRWIAGILDDRELTSADYDRAIANIEAHFDWVGVTERFDESLVDLAFKFGWPRVYYRKRNVGAGEPRPPAADVVQAIRERNRFDVLLYDHVVRRMDAVRPVRAAARRIGVAALRFANSLGTTLPPARARAGDG